jgi:nitroreductase/FMN reductase [NAD(P)H]
MSDDKNNAQPAGLLREALQARFGETFAVDENLSGLDELARMANRRVLRRFTDRAVDPALLRMLCACALSAPSKSDLQQAEILIVKDPARRSVINELLKEQAWVSSAPVLIVFLANGRRIVEISKMCNKPFPNDHLDLFFNASVDAGIVLATFLRAADAVGLGTCPISGIRQHAQRVSELLELPDKVIPVAGMGLGWPSEKGNLSPRLSLASSVHEDRYDEGDLAQRLAAFDQRRDAVHHLKQRDTERWGTAPFYGWSEDKARHFADPSCADFGEFVRRKGFRLD